MSRYQTARARAQLVDVLLAAQIALYTLRTLGGLWLAVAGETSALSTMIVRGARMSMPFLLLLFIGTAIAFLLWLDRAARNLPSLGVAQPIEPEHTVGAFLVPLFNVALAPWVVWRLWRQSDPTPPANRRDARLLAGWWPPLLASLVLQPLGASLAVDLLRLLSALSLVAIVRDVQRRQDAQWLDLEQRRAVPPPSAAALR